MDKSILNKPLRIEDIKRISLDILIDVHEFCVNNNIHYSLGYGTMLGAVRHKGFIPWDDDIDIIMLRQDYEKFIKSYRSENYDIIYHDKNKDYILPYAKVIDNSTVLINSWMPKLKMGIGIDIFPIDYIGDDEKNVKRVYRNKTFYNYLYIIKVLDYRWRGIFKSSFLLISKILLFWLSKSYLCEKLESYGNKYGRHSGYWGQIVTCDSASKCAMSYDIYSTLKLYDFENQKFYGIDNSDEYLKHLYGNYMKLPPKEKQMTHHDSDGYYL